VLALSAPAAARAAVVIDGSPVNVYADGFGALQMRYDGQASGVFFDPAEDTAHAGLEIKDGDAYYPLESGFDTAVGRTSTAPPAITSPSPGTQVMHSEYTVGDHLRVAEDLTYTNGTQYVDVRYAIANVSGGPVSFRAGELADLYVGDNDNGNGVVSTVAPRFVGGQEPVSKLVSGLVEQTPWTSFQEGDFEAVFDNFGFNGLNNTVDPDAADNGVGAEWAFDGVPAGASRVVTVRWLLTAPAPPGTTSPATGAAGILPPPVAGKTVNVKLARGTVRLKLPGTKRFIKLTEDMQVPLGTIFDTTHGRVTLTSAADRNGRTAHAWFYSGIFKVGQTRGARPITDLSLAGAKPSCGRRAGKRAAVAAKKKKKSRRLWGDGSGAFRTTGQLSAATVRGTKWVVIDRCDGTLTRVVRGVVAVRDFKRHKTVIVRAGKQYLARRPK